MEDMYLKLVPMHILSRGRNGGMGVEKNIVTACPECHYEEDHGQNTQIYEERMKEYLQSQYEDWNEEELIYRKYN